MPKVKDISTNICKGHSGDDYEMYLAQCECMHPDHRQHIWFEVCGDVFTMTLYHPCLLERKSLWDRLKIAFRVICNRTVELEGDFVFSKESLADYIAALKQGLKKVERNIKDGTI